MKRTIEVIEPKLFAVAVAEEIQACVEDAVAARGRCSLVLAGGTTPAAIYRVLARPPKVQEIPWAKVHLYWGDERWVPKDDQQSNFRMVSETLLSQLPEPGPVVHAVDTSLPSVQVGAAAYAEHIAAVEQLKPGELPYFDVVLLGCGDDGHTASLFPNTPELDSHGQITHAVMHPSGSNWRVSLSADALFNAQKVLFIVSGESKRDVVKRILEGTESARVLPCKLAEQAKHSVTWFIDSAAAQNLAARA